MIRFCVHLYMGSRRPGQEGEGVSWRPPPLKFGAKVGNYLCCLCLWCLNKCIYHFASRSFPHYIALNNQHDFKGWSEQSADHVTRWNLIFDLQTFPPLFEKWFSRAWNCTQKSSGCLPHPVFRVRLVKNFLFTLRTYTCVRLYNAPAVIEYKMSWIQQRYCATLR